MPEIKIVDDDVEFAENLLAALKREGFSTSMRNHIEGLVEDLVKNTPDLLILDVMFPGNPVAGFDAAREIRRKKGIDHLPIILLTAVNQEFPTDFSVDDIDPDWLPVQDFVEKPVSPQHLVRKINKLLKKHQEKREAANSRHARKKNGPSQ